MLPTIADPRPVVPTIRWTREAVEAYWDEFAPTDAIGPGADLGQALDPLDGFLVHLLLDFLPRGVVVADLASGVSRGATTAVALNHPSPRRVLAAVGRDVSADSVGVALGEYARHRGTAPRLDVLATPNLPPDLAARNGLVILTDVRTAEPATLAESVGRWLDARPDAVIAVLGVGPVGEAGVLDELLLGCRSGSGRRLWLCRELAEALVGSRLAVVARQGHPHADNALVRITHAFTGNGRYLDLLWDVNLGAIRAAGADVQALAAHPSGVPVMNEINKHKQLADAARQEADRLRQLLHDMEAAAVRDLAALRASVAHRDRELWELRSGFVYRAALRAKRFRQWVAPDGTIRHRALRKARRGSQILKAEGVWSFLTWTVGRHG